jgi:hypothetical protein
MTGRLLRVVAWLTLALHALAGLGWALVSTPDSNLLMLTLSAVLMLALLLVAALALDGALRLWSGVPLRPVHVWRSAVHLLPALVVFGVIWWAAQAAGARVEASRGAITAAIIARTGWADPEIVFTVARWLTAFVGWVIGPLVGLALFDALARGDAGDPRRRWLRRALSWQALAGGALIVFVLMWFWPALEAWRPALPPTRVQLVFAGAKIVAGLTALAVALASLLRLATLEPRTPPPSVHDPAQSQRAA